MQKYFRLLSLVAIILLLPGSETASTSKPDSLEADSFIKKAEDFWRDLQYDSSNFYYNKASELFQKYQNWKDYIDCQKNIGLNYRYLGDYSRALTYLNKGLNALNNLSESPDSLRAELYNNVGSIYYEKENYKKAYRYFQDMLQINQRIFGIKHTNTGKGYLNVGLIYYSTGDYDKAIQYFERALSIWDSTLSKDNPLVANAYSSMSKAYLLGKQYPKSIEYAEKALDIWKGKLGETHPYIAVNYSDLADIYNRDGNYNKALEYDYKAMQIKRDFAGEESREVAGSYADIGDVFIKLGNLNNGKFFLNKSINLYRKVDPSNPGLSLAYILSGKLHRKNSEYKVAEAYYDSALYVAWPAYNPGIVGPDDVDKIPIDKQLLAALIEKGNTYGDEAEKSTDQSVLDRALNLYTLVSDAIEKQKIGYGQEEYALSTAERLYEVNKYGVRTALKLYQLTKNSEYIESAFMFAERSKAGILAKSIYASGAEKFSGISDSLINTEEELKSNLTFYSKRLEAARKSNDLKAIENSRSMLSEYQRKYFELLDYYKKNFRNYYNLKYGEELTSTDEIRNLLPSNAAVIEYFTGDTTISIFILTRNSINAVTVNCDSGFFSEVRKFRESLAKLNYIDYLSTAGNLYTKLILPVKNFISNKSKIYIIPAFIFAYLPFEALLTRPQPQTFNRDFIHLPYLIKDYDISYDYSAALLKEAILRKKNFSRMSFAGFAPLFFDYHNYQTRIASVIDTNLTSNKGWGLFSISGKSFSSLPETEKEVHSIGDLFREYNYPYRLFIDKTSTEHEFQSDTTYEYNFIQLAAQGFIFDDHPELTGLIFYHSGQDSAYDGVLYTGDIFNLKLSADLLALSTCECNPGYTKEGEGIYALIRGFLYSGAGNIVISLWQVADKSTAVLMTSFYKNILEGMEYASALRKAKLDMIREGQYAYPFEWGPFVLIGR